MMMVTKLNLKYTATPLLGFNAGYTGTLQAGK
jgi:hypothetical protein